MIKLKHIHEVYAQKKMRYAWNRYTWNIHKIHMKNPWNIHEICKKYTLNIHKIHMKYAWNTKHIHCGGRPTFVIKTWNVFSFI